MRIGDIEVGKEYGITPGEQTRRTSSDLPRRVTAVAVEVVEVEHWSSGYAQGRVKRNVRHVRVRFEDDARAEPGYWRDQHLAVPKGQERVVEPRFIIAPWKDLRKDVEARVAAEDEKAAAKNATLARVKALLPKNLQREWITVRVEKYHGRRGVHVEVHLEGRALETILALAEKGKATDG